MVRRTGVHERMLRYYEQQGLLAPDRLPSGYREFSDADVETVGRVRCLLEAGLPTALIAEVLPCLALDGERLRPTCPDVIASLEQQRARMTQAIEALTTSRALLTEVLA